MKKVLVTGAGGTLGKLTVEQLLKMDDVEVTTIDLRTSKYHRAMRKFRKKINIVYGDITDDNIVNELIKENDYVIHLAGVMPPLANLKSVLLNEIDYNGTENILKAISYYNPDCFLIYPSTTSVYNPNKDMVYNVDSKLSNKNNDYYSQYKIKIEKTIAKKINNYVIYRIPFVLSAKKMIYNIPLNQPVETITDNDTAIALAKSIDKCKKINKKIFNLANDNTKTYYKDLLINIFKNYGLTLSYLFTLIFLSKNFNTGYYSDTKEIKTKLAIEYTNLDDYFKSVKQKYKYRFLSRLLAKPFIYFINIKYNKKRVG